MKYLRIQVTGGTRSWQTEQLMELFQLDRCKIFSSSNSPTNRISAWNRVLQRWTANPLLPPNEEGGSNGRGRGDVIDYVEVSNLYSFKRIFLNKTELTETSASGPSWSWARRICAELPMGLQVHSPGDFSPLALFKEIHFPLGRNFSVDFRLRKFLYI